jgi:hypothetical protein
MIHMIGTAHVELGDRLLALAGKVRESCVALEFVSKLATNGFEGEFHRMNLSAFLWARRLKGTLPARLRESVAKQDRKLVNG